MLLVGRRATQLPVVKTPEAAIDWGHPLAQKLAACWSFGGGGGGPVELVRQQRASLVAAPAWVATPRGKAIRIVRASNQYVEHALVGQLTGIHPMTVLAVVRQSTLSNLTRNIVAFGDQAAPANGWSLRTSTATAIQNFVRIGTGTVLGTSITQISTTTDFFLVGAWADGANVRFFRVNLTSGAFAAETIASTAAFQAPVDFVCRLGADVSTTLNTWDGDIAFVAVWRGRKLTDRDVQDLARNPAALLVASDPARWSIVLPSTGAQDVLPDGILSGETWGTPVIVKDQLVSPSGIASGEAWGNPTVAKDQLVSPGGIASQEGWGTPTVGKDQLVQVSAIPSGGGWGTPVVGVEQLVSPSGIASQQAFGTPSVAAELGVQPSGIASQESWGTPLVGTDQLLSPSGIPSAEVWGAIKLLLNIGPAGGVASAEAWGSPTVTFGASPQTLAPSGIPSGEAFGTPSVAREQLIQPAGVASGETWGTPLVTGGDTVVNIGVRSRTDLSGIS